MLLQLFLLGQTDPGRKACTNTMGYESYGPRGPSIKVRMQTLEKVMLQTSVGAWGLAAWLLLCDAELIPERFAINSINGMTLHWQIFLVAGAVLLATRDQVSDLRCRCCGNHADLSFRAIFKFRELLCKSCLAWDPQVTAKPAGKPQSNVPGLFPALKQ